MLSGKFDNYYPTVSSQEPLFKLLGTPAEHKLRREYEAAHNIPKAVMIKEVVGWMEKYLGETAAALGPVAHPISWRVDIEPLA